MTLTSRHVTTAKPRRCFGCGRTMLTGTLMRRASEDASEDAGVHLIIKTWWCMACERYRDELLDADDKVYPGEIRSEDPQRWERFRVRVEAEFARFLVEAAESGPPVVLSRRGRRYERREISGPDRARLYRLAAATGFRANEIRTLTPERFRFGDNPSITVLAQHAKNRREAVQPIGVKFAESIRPWIESLPPDRPILPVPDKTADMLRDDLDAAGIPYVDSRGLTADFHALRVTFITDLARRGVHPAKAQQLARHSDVKLTLGVYTRFADAEIREALEDA